MSEHWYDRSGAAAHSTNGRATTLRDARKLGLCPSVTTVLGILDKPALTEWKVRQGILAALTLPRNESEPEETYLARILIDSKQQAQSAADEGTRIHDAIEQHFLGGTVPEEYRPHLKAVRSALWQSFPGVTDWVAEKSFAHPSGYGGKVDLHSPSTGIVVDYKGKDIAPEDTKRLAYDQHYQLAAYQHGLGLKPTIGCNLFISRTHPGHVVPHLWTEVEMARGLTVFQAALALWKAVKSYDAGFTV